MEVREVYLNNINIANYEPYKLKSIVEYYPKLVLAENLPQELIKKVLKDIYHGSNRVNLKKEFKHPTTGDYILIDGQYARIVIFGDHCQTTSVGSFFMYPSGNCSYSGGFDAIQIPHIRIDELELTDELEMGEYWIFSNDDVKGNNGVWLEGEFKVWKIK